MNRQVNCCKLGKIAPGLASPPYANALGEKIYDNISREAWELWLKQQTILINEHRLNCSDSKARDFIMQELQLFLFGSNNNP